MATVTDIINLVNVEKINEEIKSNKFFGAFTFDQLFNLEVETLIQTKFENACVPEKSMNKYGESNFNYSIKNEEVLNTLRQLYVNTKNNFVKEVIASVGKAKFFTEKQIEVIAKEASKYNLTFNF